MVTVKMYHTKAELPKKGHPTDLAYDCKATERELNFPSSVKYKLGIRLQDDEGIGFEMNPRSNAALRGLQLDTRLIDPDYTGEITVIFFTQLRAWFPWLRKENGKWKFSWNRLYEVGDRICQIREAVVYNSHFQFGQPKETVRGNKGYGSTGVK
jgi:dUTPase